MNKANTSDTEAPFLDLHLSISNGFISSKFYDKCDDFDFNIVNFPILDDHVPCHSSYGVYILEPEFYGDLVYKFKHQFRKIKMRHKHIGYNVSVMRQSACLVINQNTVDRFAALLNCVPVDRASDSIMAPT